MDTLLNALKTIAEPTRFRILALCLQGELTVSELVRILGQSQPRISRHLKLMTEAGLLERIREGSWVFFRLSQVGIGAETVDRVAPLIPLANGQLRRDRERLAEVKRDRAEAAAAYFRENAERWNEVRSLHVDETEVEAVIAELLPPSNVSSLLDIGTGTARILELFGPQIEKGEGVDLSSAMLAVARANLEQANLGHCRVRHGDLYQLPYPEGGFDAVTIHQVLHFVDDQALAVSEAARVLGPGGRLLIVDFAPHALESLRTDDEHRRLGFDTDEVTGWLVLAGLELRETRHLPGDPLTVSLWLAEKPATAGVGTVSEETLAAQ